MSEVPRFNPRYRRKLFRLKNLSSEWFSCSFSRLCLGKWSSLINGTLGLNMHGANTKYHAASLLRTRTRRRKKNMHWWNRRNPDMISCQIWLFCFCISVKNDGKINQKEAGKGPIFLNLYHIPCCLMLFDFHQQWALLASKACYLIRPLAEAEL